MKKILTIILVFVMFASCTKLEDLNKNIKDPAAVSGESLFTGAQKRLFDQMVSSNVNFNISRLIMQYWCETTYLDESNYDLVTRTIPDNHWDRIYIQSLKNLDEATKVIKATSYPNDANTSIKTNKLAIIDVMAVYSWSNLVEMFGDIPYTQALDINTLYPKYDDGLTIYKDLIARLNADITTLNAGSAAGSFDAADNMYQGDVPSWIKFANSLKLRMGMLLSDIPAEAALAKATVEAAAPNVFTSNADNARLLYGSSQPNTNPIWEDLVASGRHDFVPTNTLVDTMNNWSDPRRPFYFTQIDTSTTGTPKLAYVGGLNGLSNDYYSYSHVADAIQQPTFEGLIFDYAEVEFLLAEAIERGYTVSGTAAAHYNAGITASMDYWGVSSTDIATYLAQPVIAYSSANWKEKIGMQQWLAYYNRGIESWTEWRRLDYPLLVAPPDAVSDIPVRYTYPIEEQTLNGASYQAASAAIGGDDVATKLFWDKN
jgi:hypothetical protein